MTGKQDFATELIVVAMT